MHHSCQSSCQSNIRDREIKALERIAIALERLAPPVRIPNYQFPLEAFETFDWESIAVCVEEIDRQGPSVVNWEGIRFQRQSPANRFRDAISFAKVSGRNEHGEPIYQRLITFRAPASVGPVPERVKRLVQSNGNTVNCPDKE